MELANCSSYKFLFGDYLADILVYFTLVVIYVFDKLIATLAANADKVAAYKGGQEKLFGFFVGQVMKASGGKANPAAVNELLKKALG